MNAENLQNPTAVLVQFTIIAGKEDVFLEVLLPHLRRVAAEQTCRTMRVNRDPSNPSVFMLYEEWDDAEEFLQVQMKRSYRIPYNEALEPLEAADRVVSLWTPLPL